MSGLALICTACGTRVTGSDADPVSLAELAAAGVPIRTRSRRAAVGGRDLRGVIVEVGVPVAGAVQALGSFGGVPVHPAR
jgi:UDP-N-acetylmuramate-alanine ligase